MIKTKIEDIKYKYCDNGDLLEQKITMIIVTRFKPFNTYDENEKWMNSFDE